MTKANILLICSEPSLADSIVRDLDRSLGACVNQVATVEQASLFGGVADQALVLLALKDMDDLGRANGLLWSCSMARTPVPVIAISDRYDESQALMLFRMGVEDYLSLNDHRDAIPAVVGRLLPPQSDDADDEPTGRPARLIRAPRPLAASWPS